MLGPMRAVAADTAPTTNAGFAQLRLVLQESFYQHLP